MTRLKFFSLCVRRANAGGRLYLAVLIGRLPSKSMRAWGAARLLGVRLDPSAQLYRWRDLRCGPRIEIGRGSIVGTDCILDGRRGIKIGRSVNLSSEVALWTLQHDKDSPTFEAVGGPIVIHDRAWVSFRATVLPNVTIGEGAVVAAGAVVTGDVAPYDVVGGIPARKIGQRPRAVAYSWHNSRKNAPWFV